MKTNRQFKLVIIALLATIFFSCENEEVEPQSYNQFVVEYTIVDQHIGFQQSIVVNHLGQLSIFQQKEQNLVLTEETQLSYTDQKALLELLNRAQLHNYESQSMRSSDSLLNAQRTINIQSNLGDKEVIFARPEELPLDFTVLLGELSGYLKKYPK